MWSAKSPQNLAIANAASGGHLLDLHEAIEEHPALRGDRNMRTNGSIQARCGRDRADTAKAVNRSPDRGWVVVSEVGRPAVGQIFEDFQDAWRPDHIECPTDGFGQVLGHVAPMQPLDRIDDDLSVRQCGRSGHPAQLLIPHVKGALAGSKRRRHVPESLGN
jgi:hypothetical protein